jgi:hypothetical protein
MALAGALLAVVSLVTVLSRLPTAAAPRRVLQPACACATCVSKGNTVADCTSFGLDCSYYSGGCSGYGGACADLGDRTAAVNDECCNEKTVEDCSSGRPATCNLGCAHVLLPFFDDCAGALGTTGAAQFDGIVALCRAAEDAPPVRHLSSRPRLACDRHAVSVSSLSRADAGMPRALSLLACMIIP